MIHNVMIILGGALCLSACVTAQTPGSAPLETMPTERAVSAGGLGPQVLEQGECGLFLWTLAEPRKLVFFSKAGSGAALSMIAESEAQYVQTSSAGDIFGQFKTDMTFATEASGETLNVSIAPGDMLEDGQRTEAASLTLTGGDGWETIVPVRGVRACRAG